MAKERCSMYFFTDANQSDMLTTLAKLQRACEGGHVEGLTFVRGMFNVEYEEIRKALDSVDDSFLVSPNAVILGSDGKVRDVFLFNRVSI